MRESVNTIITDAAGKYLLQMRDGTPGICNPLKWNFFGGGLDGEDPLTAARRELAEELGVVAFEAGFELLGQLEFEGGLVHIARLVQPLGWKDITIGEGAGAGYFTREQIAAIDSTDQTRAIASSFL